VGRTSHDLPIASPGHRRRGLVNVDKFSGTKLPSLHQATSGTYPSSVDGLLPAFSSPPRYLPFHRAALSTPSPLFPNASIMNTWPSSPGIVNLQPYSSQQSCLPTVLKPRYSPQTKFLRKDFDKSADLPSSHAPSFPVPAHPTPELIQTQWKGSSQLFSFPPRYLHFHRAALSILLPFYP